MTRSPSLLLLLEIAQNSAEGVRSWKENFVRNLFHYQIQGFTIFLLLLTSFGFGLIRMAASEWNILYFWDYVSFCRILKSIILYSLITLKRVTSLRVSLTQLFWKKCCSGDEPLATLCPIWPIRDLNLRPAARKTNALPLDQLTGCIEKSKYAKKFTSKNSIRNTQKIILK